MASLCSSAGQSVGLINQGHELILIKGIIPDYLAIAQLVEWWTVVGLNQLGSSIGHWFNSGLQEIFDFALVTGSITVFTRNFFFSPLPGVELLFVVPVQHVVP